MGLRENEKRILAAMEEHLTEDDPQLAGRLSSFGADDTDTEFAFADRAPLRRALIICAAVAIVVIGLLAALFLATPGSTPPDPADTAPPPSGDPGAASSFTIGMPVPLG